VVEGSFINDTKRSCHRRFQSKVMEIILPNTLSPVKG
jgi:hypothetical protein